MNLMQIAVDGLSNGATYMLLALGLSLAFSVMGLINFAYGMVLVLAAYALSGFYAAGLPYEVALIAAALTTTVLSVALGRLVFVPFIGSPPATLLLVSFGVALALQSAAIMLFGETPRAVPTPSVLITSIDLGVVRISVLQIVALLLGVIVLVGLDLIVNRTRWGIAMRAVAEDAATARLCSVDSRRVVLLVFALSGLIAAVVAFVWFAQVGTVTPRSDFNPTLKAFVAVTLGGLGTVRGAVIGGLLLGMVESAVASTVGVSLLSYQQTIAFVIVILVLLVRPQGIGGKVVEMSK